MRPFHLYEFIAEINNAVVAFLPLGLQCLMDENLLIYLPHSVAELAFYQAQIVVELMHDSVRLIVALETRFWFQVKQYDFLIFVQCA